MILEKLTIKNLGCIKGIELDLKNGAYLIGPNGAGKTTILNAIRLLLRGDSDFKGSLAEYIRPGAKSATIGGDLRAKDGKLYRAEYKISAKKSDFVINNEGGRKVGGRKDLWRILGYDEGAAKATCYPDDFLWGEGIRGLLSSHLGADMGKDALIRYCKQEGVDYVGEIIDFADADALEDREVPDTSIGWNDIGGDFYKERTRIGKERVKLAVKCYTLGEQPTGKGGKLLGRENIEDLEFGVLKEIGCTIEELSGELGFAKGAAAQRDVKPVDVGALQAEITGSVNLLSQLREKLTILKETQATLEAARQNAASEWRSARDVRREAESTAKKLQVRISDIQVATECNVCGRDWTPDERADAAEALRTLIADGGDLCLLSEAEARANDLMQETDSGCNENDADLDALGTRLHEANLKHSADCATMESANNRPVPVETRTLDAIQADIDKETGRQTRGKDLLKELKDWCEAKDHFDELEKVQNRWEFLDWCVKAFKDGKFQQFAIAPAMDEFCTKVNSSGLSGLILDWDNEGGNLELHVNKVHPDGLGQPILLRDISTAEESIVKMAIAKAFAPECGGLGLLDMHGLWRGNILALSDMMGDSEFVCAFPSPWAEDFLGDEQEVDDFINHAGAAACYWIEDGKARQMDPYAV